MKRPLLIMLLIAVAATVLIQQETALVSAQQSRISVRTETFPRPPYSGATYYIYEREGEVVCTKLEVCNKYDNCSQTYKKGSYKVDEDVQTGDPYGKTEPVFISQKSLKKHTCLKKFKLIS